MIARAARAEDCAGAVACGMRFALRPPEPEALAELFDESLACGGLFLAEDDERIIGLLCALKQPHPFTGRDFINVLAWWVPREHRGTGAALVLLRTFLRWCSTQGVELVTISAPIESNIGHVLRSHGYAPVETVWMKGV